MKLQYQIMKTRDGSTEYWTVCRTDGKSFGDGWLGLNFSLDDWQLAIDCRKKLEEDEKKSVLRRRLFHNEESI